MNEIVRLKFQPGHSEDTTEHNGALGTSIYPILISLSHQGQAYNLCMYEQRGWWFSFTP